MPPSPPETRASLILRLRDAADMAAWDEFTAISGNDAPLVQEGDDVRLEFEGWPATQSAGSFEGKVMTIDATADDAGKFRVLIKQHGNVAWPDERYLRPGVRAIGWVFTGSHSDKKSAGKLKTEN